MFCRDTASAKQHNQKVTQQDSEHEPYISALHIVLSICHSVEIMLHWGGCVGFHYKSMDGL